MDEKLRSGYTTGTCAAAAAKAAALLLFEKRRVMEVSVSLPEGRMATLPVSTVSEDHKTAMAEIIKDAGDDPDITNGRVIRSSVAVIDRTEYETLLYQNQGYAYHESCWMYLIGGVGVGIVTRNGLSCEIGHYAINPVPRQMIVRAVGEVLSKQEDEVYLLITISIPEGAELAKQTFNPKLGIMHGISIIGTSGIVKPMSEDAIRDTIRLELHMQVCGGKKQVILTPGNYGERYLKETLGLSLSHAVCCSNYVAETIEMAASEGIASLLFVGHMGKLIKVTGGVRNTHSKYGDRRMELLANLVPAFLQEAVLACNTTDEAIGLLNDEGIAQHVMNQAALLIRNQCREWYEQVSKAPVALEVIAFSATGDAYGKTPGADAWIEMLQTKEQQNKEGDNRSPEKREG